MRRLKADLHTHTAEDPRDGIDYSAEMLIEAAAKFNVDVLATQLRARQVDILGPDFTGCLAALLVGAFPLECLEACSRYVFSRSGCCCCCHGCLVPGYTVEFFE